MEVILLEKVANVGVLGDKVSVKSGFARNFLIPQGKAVFASEQNLAAFEARRAELEARELEKMGVIAVRKAQLQALEEGIRVAHQVGQEGKLFGSVGAAEIVAALAAEGVEIEKSAVRLPVGGLRKVGEHEVLVHLQADVDVALKVSVVSA